MKFSLTRNPNNLSCPICGKMIKLDIHKNNILCGSCKTELLVDKKSKQLKYIGYIFMCLPAIVIGFLNLDGIKLGIFGGICLVITFLCVGISNGSAKLIAKNGNT